MTEHGGIRVCITGATGFLGGALARALALGGADVHALRRPTSERGALDDVKVTWHEGDVTDPATLERFLAGADWVVHAAGRLGEFGVPEAAYVAANVEGTRNVMAAALAGGPRQPRVLHLSSSGVLGPTADAAGEDAPCRPTNAYERSKAAAEEVAREFVRKGLPVVLARPGFIYGPGDRHVLRLYQAIHRGRFFLIEGGRRRCQPTYVADAVAGMIACLRDGRPGEAYHLVGPRAVTFRELGEAIASALRVRPPRLSLPRWPVMMAAGGLELLGAVTHRRAPLTRNGVAFFSEDRVVSWQKARRELGYVPAHDIADGAARTVAWYRERRWL
jgi:nucleoside-diphosphate-sugar epimerase